MIDYDRFADGYDRRYALHSYDGIRDTIDTFLGTAPLSRILEVACGTGHWLHAMAGRANVVAGVDISTRMLTRARASAPGAIVVRADAERLPYLPAVFDRVVCVNALHHFSTRDAFFTEARRVLRPGGGLLTVGLDPHPERDQWWVYDFFPETRAVDLARFARVREIRGEMTKAGFTWAESFEADRLESQLTLADVFPDGIDRSFTSQFSAMSDDAFARGAARLREAGDDVCLATDLRFYATIGWLS